jgi:hypothetical protein
VKRGLLVLLAALVAAPAAYGAATLSLTVNTASPVTAPAVTLNGVDQTKTFSVSTSITYTGGQNTAGWNLTAAAPAPTSGSSALPALTVTGVSAGSCSGSNCVDPQNSVAWPVTLSSAPAKIFNAAVNTGQGTVALTSTYQVAYPANVLPGTYSTTVSFAVTTGP